jgi:hypothetical protein
MHLDVMVPLKKEGSKMLCVNIPYLVLAAIGKDVSGGIWLNLLSLAVVGGMALLLMWVLWKTPAGPQLFWRTSIAMIVIMLTMECATGKSSPQYLGYTLCLMAAVMAATYKTIGKWSIAAYILLTFLTLPVSSLCFWPLYIIKPTTLHQAVMAGNTAEILTAVLCILLTALYVWFIVRFLRLMLSAKESQQYAN